MTDDKWEINLRISYNINCSDKSIISLVIWPYDITIAFLLECKLWQTYNIWDYGFDNKKKPPKPLGELRRKPCIQLVEKPPKPDKKSRKKTGYLINKKPFKPNKKTRTKTNYSYIALYKMKNLRNVAKKTKKKPDTNWLRIGTRWLEVLNQRLEHSIHI